MKPIIVFFKIIFTLKYKNICIIDNYLIKMPRLTRKFMMQKILP